MKLFKRILKIFAWSLLTLTVIVTGLIVYILISVRPTVLFVRWAFDQTQYTPHAELSTYQSEVLLLEDETYPSSTRKNQFDVFIRQDLKDETNIPTILWIHGGAFIAGSKADVKDYMYVLAYQGYAVISMNYGLGNEYQYPTPLIQINELYTHLNSTSNYSYIDLENLVIGGDSAGAFIAAQYAIVQTNQAYATLIDMEPKIQPSHIKGMMLFCGPYDFQLITNLLGERQVRSTTGFLADVLVPFIAGKIGEAYLGDANWSSSGAWAELSLLDFVNSDFPRTYITDGNTMSFEDHGRLLESKLSDLGIEVESTFYDATLMHEYQFSLSTIHEDGRNYGMETLEDVLDFLEATYE